MSYASEAKTTGVPAAAIACAGCSPRWARRLSVALTATTIVLTTWLSPQASFAQSQTDFDAGVSTEVRPDATAVTSDGGSIDSSGAEAVRTPSATAVAAPSPIPWTPPVGHAAQETLHTSTSPPRTPFKLYRYWGLGTDLGVSGPLPDAGLLLIGRPVRWVHLHAGATTNFLAFGMRAGLTVINPYLVPLSLTCEAGHFFAGNANHAKRWFSSNTEDIALLQDFSYNYVNLLGGLVLETTHVVFFMRAGPTWAQANLNNFQRTLYDASKVQVQSSDPKLSYRGPSLRLGLFFFL